MSQTIPPTRSNDRFSSSFVLALSRLHQSGWLLPLASLGFLAAIIIACVVPLFTSVAAASSLQTILQADPARNTITLSVNTRGLSSNVASTVQHQITPLIQQKLGPYQDGATSLTIQEPSILVQAPASLQYTAPLNLYATSLDTLKPHLHLLTGRWPAPNTNELEIMLTPTSAANMYLTLGARLTLQGDFATVNRTGGITDPRTTFNARLVGLFDVQTPAPVSLHGHTFQPDVSGAAPIYTMLTDTTDFLQTLDQSAARLHTSAIYSYLTFQLSWDYPLHTSNVQPAQLNDLINRLFTAQTNAGNYQNNQQQAALNTPDFPYVTQVSLYSPAPGSLELLDLLQQYNNRATLVSIPISILALQIITLLLFFVSLLVSTLLDRQRTASALLSSRGASGAQIFWSLFLQCVALCLLGIIIGPPIAIALVSLLATRILPVGSAHITQSIIAQPAQVISIVGPNTVITLLAALLTLGFIVRYTSGLNMLTMRRETARVTRPPFWQRYYLDMLAAVVALSAYGVSLYLAGIAHEVDITTQDLILAPLTLIAPLFLLLGCLLLFLRIFPHLLRFGSWIAQRGRGATATLALVQMARSPRQVTRMTLLLSLTIAFAIFAQVFSASQMQRINDISTYESGADFSGNLPVTLTVQHLPLHDIIAHYQAIPGVLAASVDYMDQGTTTGGGGQQVTIQFHAIDVQSFSQTIIWKNLNGGQGALYRSIGANGNASVPAIIDQALANQLQVTLGSVFSMSLNHLTESTLSYHVVAVVAHIPTVNSSATGSTSGAEGMGGVQNETGSYGGMLASYQALTGAYAKIYASETQARQIAPPVIPINHVWLRTRDDSRSLASARAALNTFPLALTNLYDRREIAAELQQDPFTLNILTILSVGGIAAFLLAFIGNLISSWLSVRTRRGSFVVLRALGSTSGQVIGMLLWEQGIVYFGALLLGLAFGAVLASVAVPVLVSTGLPLHGPMSTISISSLYLIQTALPPQITVPSSLSMIFVALVPVCLVAFATVIGAALRPSMSRELRLDDD